MNEPTASRAPAAVSAPAAGDPAQAPMEAAIAAARRALAAGEPPIGACVAQDGRIVATAHNGVAGGPDATAHAEILAIREACRVLRASRLEDCILYTTVEPCPMCLAACHYAGIAQVVHGASLADLQAITGRELQAPPPPGVAQQGGLLAEDCRQLLQAWAATPRRRTGP